MGLVLSVVEVTADILSKAKAAARRLTGRQQMDVIRNFTADEFACKCGKCDKGYDDMQDGFLRRLEQARAIADTPFTITSAIRCPEWNRKVGGVDSSAHVEGWAVDVAATTGGQRFTIMQAAMDAGFNRIGIAGNFIHMDCDPRKPANVVWTY